MLKYRQSQREETYRDLEDGGRQTDRRERTGSQMARENREWQIKELEAENPKYILPVDVLFLT